MRSCLAVAVIAACLPVAGPAAAHEEVRAIEGAALYRERIALPDDAYLRVETRDADGAFFAAARMRTMGGQVPLPFAVAAPFGAQATLHVEIEIPEGAGWRSAETLIPAGRGARDVGALMLTRSPARLRRERFLCGETEVAVRLSGADATLTARGEEFHLASARAASGAKYESPDDPTTFFWSKGDADPMISIRAETLPDCAPAARPVDFRAGGNEPGWSLTFMDGRAALETDYGAERREAMLDEPVEEDGAIFHRIAAIGAVIRIEDGLCHDGATGMPYPETVAVTTATADLSGCGGAPLSLLTGGEWLLEALGGEMVEGPRARFTFGDDGRVAGRAGCNQFSASFTLTGESLTFSRAAMTMMACPPAQMAQERRFAEALEKTVIFDIDAAGALILKSAEGAPLMRARRGR
ncbi:META domain-containing protein [Pikeienuella sp. HZG-20]|uniref:META domain-containing protein n=1 Tax=Paludibacillus litoralis TaxID=3133267 RepID=UPI0030EE4C4F